jgi:competence protein ComFC
MARLQPSRAFALYQFIWSALDWLYPPYCIGCGKMGFSLCVSCISKINPLGEKICPVCGIPQSSKQPCPECKQDNPPVTQLRSYAFYQDLARNCILRIKFHREIGLGASMADILIQFYQTLNWKIDLVTTIPLSYKRLKSRGYNQSALLARPLAYFYGLPYTNRAVKRILHTQSQIGLNREERHRNVVGAFHANSTIAARKNILLVDDVATTGSTIYACAKALLEAGASEVFGLTFARAATLHEDTEIN